MSWRKTFKIAGEQRELQIQNRKEREEKFKTVEVEEQKKITKFT